MIASLAPQAALTAGVLGVLSLGLLRRPPAAAVKLLALVVLAATILLASAAPEAALTPLFTVDGRTKAWLFLIAFSSLPFALWSRGGDLDTALFLGSVLGMSLLAAASNLPMLFIALEFMSLPAYLLVARSRGGAPRSLEAAVKYFFAGGLAGALFMLGLALYYADAGTLSSTPLALTERGQSGLALMAAAALFKLGAVPLHWWLPDVYEASDPELAGFLSTAMKSAAVLFLMRLCRFAPLPAFAAWLPAVGAVTALVGAGLALRQRGLQRLLAYSSVSHAGLLVLGVGAWTLGGFSPEAESAIFFYLGAYAFMSNGAFGFLKASGLRTRAELRGWGRARPFEAAAFVVLLFSLAGIPPTGGFLAKLLVLWQAVRGAHYASAIAAAAAALISMAYYLALVRDLCLEEPTEPAPPVPGGFAIPAACAAGALLLGAAPWMAGRFFGGQP